MEKDKVKGKQYIWGTLIDFDKTVADIKELIKTAKYTALLPRATEDGYIDIDLNDVKTQNSMLHKCIIEYPTQLLHIMDEVVTEICDISVQVRVFNLPLTKRIRGLSPSDIERLVTIRGMVTRVSNLIPSMKIGVFICTSCHYVKEIDVDLRGTLTIPSKCENCKKSNTLQIDHTRSEFIDKQIIRVQEAPESMPPGETPQTLHLLAFDLLVDSAKPGDRVEITGVYRADAIKIGISQRTVRAVFNSYIDIVHVKKYTKQNVVDVDFPSLITPNWYEKLVHSLAPSITEMDDVKKGLLCQLFGGTRKVLNDQQKLRGDINVLLVGDPGTSKSQLLTFIHKVAPRGMYTSGRGSSAVGLTAFVGKSEDGGTVLESGALVMSDKGLCCIDEFDKMTEMTRSVLHEVMEQQTISVAKSGIVCSLNARTAILASANPKESRYNPKLNILENIQMPPSLLSRFDLIYLILDRPDLERDKRLARHIISLYWGEEKVTNTLDIPTFSAFVKYARKNCKPVLSQEAGETLVEGYLQMRKIGSENKTKKTVSATTRQLESLIRISEARAKMELRPLISVDDAKEAIRLVKTAILQAATDPLTGLVDYDLLATEGAPQVAEEKERPL
ncbi:DNA replication licensing factor mcm4-B, putative [Entamoeba invadens IP1]|uniref:DNA replication licensing factor MCM4 n=1 Tax=Entamoeba invadens IP1 TaxID=370355 RepID=A0A0A1TU94_ENTIV|nr:DNA replication licensing factor mcm4-B, putative [Entamoeba invadens IP1]ELP83537.1 DNA replication licensing factor mcm4-B, putative [Entamoeba invadens IP1]|eukprot:XP_004182883.1 DNA replication licensing factor mcm4-B, putative [Entamoeba invadens IP1]